MKRTISLIGATALTVGITAATAGATIAAPHHPSHHVTVLTARPAAPAPTPAPAPKATPPTTDPPPTPTSAPQAPATGDATTGSANQDPTTPTTTPAPAPVDTTTTTGPTPPPASTPGPTVTTDTGSAPDVGGAGTLEQYTLSWVVVMPDGTTDPGLFSGTEAQADELEAQLAPEVGQALANGEYPAGAILQSVTPVTVLSETVTTTAGQPPVTGP